MPSAETSNWQIFHSYQNIVIKGDARPFLCQECEIELIMRIGPDGVDAGPVLWCPSCDSVLVPGLDLIQQVTAVVKEHYL
jgi:hypothetical protein